MIRYCSHSLESSCKIEQRRRVSEPSPSHKRLSSPHLKEGMFAQLFCSSNGVSSTHKHGVSCSSSWRTGAATAALAGGLIFINAGQGASQDVTVYGGRHVN